MNVAADSPRNLEVVETSSGAPALLDRDVGEVMHPVVGPLVESVGVYVAPSRLASRLSRPGAGPLLHGSRPEAGPLVHVSRPEAGPLVHVSRPEPGPLVLLDVGLGAGSNAAAAWRVATSLPAGARRIHIVSFDRDLAALAVASNDAHASSFGFDQETQRAARSLLTAGHHRESGHEWRVVRGELPERFDEVAAGSADVVFWDPYSPKTNPALWTVAAFGAVRRLCRDGATLHTYSGATAVRSALLLAGFCVGFGVSSGSKANTTVGALRLADLDAPLDRRWLERLRRSSAALPADAPSDAVKRIERLPQFGPERAP